MPSISDRSKYFWLDVEKEYEGSITWRLIVLLDWQSGGVLQTYQQDLKEFGIGLKKETEVISGVTAHVVKDLPLSLETGASVAQVRTSYQTLIVLGLLRLCGTFLWCHLLFGFIFIFSVCFLDAVTAVVGLSHSFSSKLDDLKAFLYFRSSCISETLFMRHCGGVLGISGNCWSNVRGFWKHGLARVFFILYSYDLVDHSFNT